MKCNYRSSLQTWTALTLTFICLKANAILPYKYNWTKIESKNFTVLVDKDYLEYGKRVSTKAEMAFQALQAFSKKTPKKTFIIVDHTKGFSNGSATFFPYPIITLQPVTPSPDSTVGQYKDWLLELLIHEYTHILTFHNTKGLYTPLRWAFGSAMSPGYFLPTWYQEGIAVFNESYLSGGGRLRSSAFQAMRSELKSPSVSIANESDTGIYPFGGGPYAFGAWLNQDLLQKSPMTKASELHKRFSGRLPYLVNGAYKRVSGKSVYKSWKEQFAQKGVTSLSKDHPQGTLPYWNPKSKKLYYVRLDPYLFNEIVEVSELGSRPKVLLKSRGILRYKIYKNKIYYLRLGLHQQDHQLYTLYFFDLKTKKTTALLSGNKKFFNVRDFDILDDKIIFIDSQINKQRLLAGKLPSSKDASEDLKTLLTVNGETRLGFSRFTSQNQALITIKPAGKKEEVRKINLSNSKSKLVYSDDHIIYMSPEQNTYYILSESEGDKFITNLNMPQNKVRIRQGVKSFFMKDEQKVITSQITSKGLYLSESSLSDITENKDSIKITQDPSSFIEKPSIDFKVSKYSSFSKLAPHYIVPNAVVSPYGFSGEFSYGANIGGQDPLGLNSYSVGAFTDTITSKISSNINYTSNHFRMPIELSAGLSNEPLSLALYRKSTFASIGTHYPFRSGFGKNFSLSASALWNKTQSQVTGESTAEAKARPEFKRAGAATRLSYSNTELRTRELAPRKGFSASVTHFHYIPSTDYEDYNQTRGGLRLYFKSPLHKNHRIVFGFDGEVSDKSIDLFGTSSQNQTYRNMPAGSFAMRGLPTGGVFATDSFAVGHFEYRFPITNINWGPGLLPGFFKRITAALTADYGSFKGVSFVTKPDVQNPESRFSHSTPLYAAGGELIFEGKAFYHLPASLQIGVYKFLNKDFYDGDPEVFVGFGISGLPY